MAENRRIDSVAERLADEYVTASGEALAREHVADVVAKAAEPLADAPVRDFVPLLVENAARDRMHDEGHHVEPSEEDTAPMHVKADDRKDRLVSGFAQADLENQ
ncbi:MAG TPA: hypothetical protein VGF22_02755 [Acidimicrobiales bacterium]|jgi:hypothetical protein